MQPASKKNNKASLLEPLSESDQPSGLVASANGLLPRNGAILPAECFARMPWRWPHFAPAEMACRHCAEGYYWPDFMDRLESLRAELSRPIYILSAHRCSLHNARIGGAPLSQHLTLAVDIALLGHQRRDLRDTAKACGFTGFGYYQTFLHLDLGPKRFWYGGQKAKTLWQTL